jgi:prephenate dehydratase
MRNHLIAIQGSIASFHDLAAKKYFGEQVVVVECGTFREVCNKVSNNKVDYGIVAIENKVAGSILMNYQLIEAYDLHIVGETYLPIQLHLLGSPGSKWEDVSEIISHPMALGQCQHFLSSMEGITVSEYRDTATSAKVVSRQSGNNLAVIAGPSVAKTYNLEVIWEDVADEKINYTRFYILSKGKDVSLHPSKGSVTIKTKDEIGALSNILVLLKEANMNLTKIQSLPIPNSVCYSFHLDIEFVDKMIFEKTMQKIETMVDSLKILGMYKGELVLNYLH